MNSRITILGSTGSIGESTLDVVRRRPDMGIYALAANASVTRMLEQCREFEPDYAVLVDATAAADLETRLRADGLETRVLSGPEALCTVAAAPEADVVMAAIVGGAGLPATLAAADAGKRLLLANKESVVMGGHLFMEAVRTGGATLLPIDSEHNAIFQCLANGAGEFAQGVRRILLTGSGGPFLDLPLDAFAAVTPAQAIAHPNWSMGPKISVDSATMMNKGLELLEACWLFGVPESMVEIVLHPQSIVHSMVEYVDGSVVAQMGNPDMRTPIAHALVWPDRTESGVSSLDLVAMPALTFQNVDLRRYPCLRIAREVAGGPQSQAIALNAANEIAVDAFLDELIAFPDIPLLIERVLSETCGREANTIADVLEMDATARGLAQIELGRLRAGARH